MVYEDGKLASRCDLPGEQRTFPMEGVLREFEQGLRLLWGHLRPSVLSIEFVRMLVSDGLNVVCRTTTRPEPITEPIAHFLCFASLLARAVGL